MTSSWFFLCTLLWACRYRDTTKVVHYSATKNTRTHCKWSNDLWNIAFCCLLTDTNVSEQSATSIFNVEATKWSHQARKEAQRLRCHEEAGYSETSLQIFVRKLIYMTRHFAITEPTQNAITPGKFFAERLSSVSSAEEKLGNHKFKNSDSCDMIRKERDWY